MEESQHFVLEDRLNDLYTCLDKIQKEFCELKKRIKPAKRMRPVPDRKSTFKNNITELKPRLAQNFKVIFKMLADLSIYDKLAYDIFKSLRSAKIRYKIEDEDYALVIRHIIISIVAQIMDEDEISKRASGIQERRLYLLRKLLTVNLDDNQSIDEGEDSDIDVITPIERDTQVQTATSCQENIISSNSNKTSDVARVESCNESIIVLDVLFDAITRQTSVISDSDVDLRAHVYHIVNITYIVDTLLQHLHTLRLQVQVARRTNQIFRQSGGLVQLGAAMQRYEKSLVDNLDSVDMENPLGLFKSDVRRLLFQVRLILPWLKQV